MCAVFRFGVPLCVRWFGALVMSGHDMGDERSSGRPVLPNHRKGKCEQVVKGWELNEGIEGVNGNVKGANGGAPDFSMIIAQQLQNLLPAMLAQVSNRGNVGNQNGNVVNENVLENVGNVLVNGNWVGCSYNEFLACNHKEYDGKGGVVVLTHWIEKMENVQDMSGCSNDQKVKYTAGSFVGKALTWWNSQIRTLSREVAVMYDVERYVYGLAPLNPFGLVAENNGAKRDIQKGSAYFWKREYGIYRGYVPRIVDHVNAKKTQLLEHACMSDGNQARGRAFMLGAEEARQDPNIVTGTFTLNDHFATTLFDSGAALIDFVSTTFILLLGFRAPGDLV
ncbi:hypothetical protein Tco_1182359 [Tanacetum coccineum]